MENDNIFAETEALLLTTIGLPGRSIKEIAASTGIKPNTLTSGKPAIRIFRPKRRTSF